MLQNSRHTHWPPEGNKWPYHWNYDLRKKSSVEIFVNFIFHRIELYFGTQDSMAKTSINTKFQLIWSKNGCFTLKNRFGPKLTIQIEKIWTIFSNFGSGWNFSAILVAKQLFFQCYKNLDTHIDHQRALSDHTVESMTYGRNQA